ncbi:MAG TPA: hypothetical protein VKU41_12000 [Polyangiaceae bacterium]|nr:hypothetical protein [Polyangiaceae bacterium]
MNKRPLLSGLALALAACGGQTSSSTPEPDGSTPAASGAGSGSTAESGSASTGSTSSGTDRRASTGVANSGATSGGATTGATTGATSGQTSSGSGSTSGASTGAPSDAGCLATLYDGGPRAAPAQHRATAAACGPSTGCIPDAGGGQSCKTDTDCVHDGAYDPFSHCLHGRCAIDQCLADSDCPSTQACSCSANYYGGNSCIHPNLCVPAACHVDADCGPDGFCSPTAGYCGLVEGFYCHKPSDPCFDGTECGLGGACVYTPAAGAFCCGAGAGCAG